MVMAVCRDLQSLSITSGSRCLLVAPTGPHPLSALLSEGILRVPASVLAVGEYKPHIPCALNLLQHGHFNTLIIGQRGAKLLLDARRSYEAVIEPLSPLALDQVVVFGPIKDRQPIRMPGFSHQVKRLQTPGVLPCL